MGPASRELFRKRNICCIGGTCVSVMAVLYLLSSSPPSVNSRSSQPHSQPPHSPNAAELAEFNKLSKRIASDRQAAQQREHAAQQEIEELKRQLRESKHTVTEQEQESSQPQTVFEVTDEQSVQEIGGTFFIMDANSGNYLGAPNSDRQVDLFEHKCSWTEWTRQAGNRYFYSGIQFNKEDMEIVVAWFNEDIGWTIPFRDIVTLYRKGPRNKIDATEIHSELHFVQNIGREAHTYLNHIVQRYPTNRIAKRTLFAQGSLAKSHTPLSMTRYLESSTSPVICKINVKGTIYALEPDGYGWLKHAGKWLAERIAGDMAIDSAPFRVWHSKYVRKELPHIDDYEYSHGAIFSVSRAAILAQPYDYYTSLRGTVDHHKNPEAGHYLERSWRYIFSPPFVTEMEPVVVGLLNPGDSLKVQACAGIRSGSSVKKKVRDRITVVSRSPEDERTQMMVLYIDMIPLDDVTLTLTLADSISENFSDNARLVACSLKNRNWNGDTVNWHKFQSEASAVAHRGDLPRGALCTAIDTPAELKAGDKLYFKTVTHVIRKSHPDDHFGYLNLLVFILPREGRPLSIQAHLSFYSSKSVRGPEVTKLSVHGPK